MNMKQLVFFNSVYFLILNIYIHNITTLIFLFNSDACEENLHNVTIYIQQMYMYSFIK